MKRKSFIRSLIAVPAIPKIAAAVSLEAVSLEAVAPIIVKGATKSLFLSCMELQSQLDSWSLKPFKY